MWPRVIGSVLPTASAPNLLRRVNRVFKLVPFDLTVAVQVDPIEALRPPGELVPGDNPVTVVVEPIKESLEPPAIPITPRPLASRPCVFIRGWRRGVGRAVAKYFLRRRAPTKWARPGHFPTTASPTEAALIAFPAIPMSLPRLLNDVMNARLEFRLPLRLNLADHVQHGAHDFLFKTTPVTGAALTTAPVSAESTTLAALPTGSIFHCIRRTRRSIIRTPINLTGRNRLIRGNERSVGRGLARRFVRPNR